MKIKNLATILLSILVLSVSATPLLVKAQSGDEPGPGETGEKKPKIPGFNDGDYLVVVRLNGKPIKGVMLFDYKLRSRDEAKLVSITLAVHPSSHILNKYLVNGEDFNLAVQYIPKSILKEIEIGENTSEEEMETILDNLEEKSFGIRFLRANVVGSGYHIKKHLWPIKPRLGQAEPENPGETPPEIPERPGIRQAPVEEFLQPPEISIGEDLEKIRGALTKHLPLPSVTVYKIEAGLVQAVGG